MPITTIIYGLTDPRDHSIRYVGKTAKSPKERLKRHFKKATPELLSWFEDLRQQELEPEIAILEEIPEGFDWRIAEIDWIKQLKKEGADLLNKQRGGGDNTLMQTEKSEDDIAVVPIYGSYELMLLLGETSPALSTLASRDLNLLFDLLCLYKAYEIRSDSYEHEREALIFTLRSKYQAGEALTFTGDLINPVGRMSNAMATKDGPFSRILFMPVKIRDLLEEMAVVRINGYRRGFQPVFMGSLLLLKQLCLEIMSGSNEVS